MSAHLFESLSLTPVGHSATCMSWLVRSREAMYCACVLMGLVRMMSSANVVRYTIFAIRRISVFNSHVGETLQTHLAPWLLTSRYQVLPVIARGSLSLCDGGSVPWYDRRQGTCLLPFRSSALRDKWITTFALMSEFCLFWPHEHMRIKATWMCLPPATS